jgi:hypothetical protein
MITNTHIHTPVGGLLIPAVHTSHAVRAIDEASPALGERPLKIVAINNVAGGRKRRIGQGRGKKSHWMRQQGLLLGQFFSRVAVVQTGRQGFFPSAPPSHSSPPFLILFSSSSSSSIIVLS